MEKQYDIAASFENIAKAIQHPAFVQNSVDARKDVISKTFTKAGFKRAERMLEKAAKEFEGQTGSFEDMESALVQIVNKAFGNYGTMNILKFVDRMAQAFAVAKDEPTVDAKRAVRKIAETYSYVSDHYNPIPEVFYWQMEEFSRTFPVGVQISANGAAALGQVLAECYESERDLLGKSIPLPLHISDAILERDPRYCLMNEHEIESVMKETKQEEEKAAKARNKNAYVRD